MLRQSIGKLAARQSLTAEEACAACLAIMDGEATDAQIAGFLMGLRLKGETTEELGGLIRAMQERMVRVEHSLPVVLDTCGTGGDGHRTFNISTAAAFVCAGAGVPVAKHGNRSVSSSSGSADVMEALGVRVALTAEEAAEALGTIGFVFLFAPAFHPAMRHVAQARKDLGVRTVFNVLGPLLNPASATHRLVGVSAPELIDPVVEALAMLGVARAVVVHAEDGMDEVSIAAHTRILEVNGRISADRSISPAEVGLKTAKIENLIAEGPEESATRIKDVFGGMKGPARDAVLLNAGVALFAAGATQSIPAGIARAAASIDTGRARGVLDEYIAFTTRAPASTEARP